jgi:hypothetical protein
LRDEENDGNRNRVIENLILVVKKDIMNRRRRRRRTEEITYIHKWETFVLFKLRYNTLINLRVL